MRTEKQKQKRPVTLTIDL